MDWGCERFVFCLFRNAWSPSYCSFIAVKRHHGQDKFIEQSILLGAYLQFWKVSSLITMVGRVAKSLLMNHRQLVETEGDSELCNL